MLVKDLNKGDMLEIETLNSTYWVHIIDAVEKKVRIWGGKYSTKMTEVLLLNDNLINGQSMVILESDNKMIQTSTVQAITFKRLGE